MRQHRDGVRILHRRPIGMHRVQQQYPGGVQRAQHGGGRRRRHLVERVPVPDAKCQLQQQFGVQCELRDHGRLSPAS
jgi:hypothetical protein